MEVKQDIFSVFDWRLCGSMMQGLFISQLVAIKMRKRFALVTRSSSNPALRKDSFIPRNVLQGAC